METALVLLGILVAATSLEITAPQDGETYDGTWLPLRARVENENAVPDSVHYTLNGQPAAQVPRMDTDWYTYMQNDEHHGFSESPAPMDNTILWAAPVTGDYHDLCDVASLDGTNVALVVESAEPIVGVVTEEKGWWISASQVGDGHSEDAGMYIGIPLD